MCLFLSQEAATLSNYVPLMSIVTNAYCQKVRGVIEKEDHQVGIAIAFFNQCINLARVEPTADAMNTPEIKAINK